MIDDFVVEQLKQNNYGCIGSILYSQNIVT